MQLSQKTKNIASIVAVLCLLVSGLIAYNYKYSSIKASAFEGENEEEENELYCGPQAAADFQLKRTQDVATGKIPTGAWYNAIKTTQQLVAQSYLQNSQNIPFTERGPNTDVVGPSNGNSRANGAITAGRIRSIMVDSLDPARKTVWVGSVSGGMWKTTDISATNPNWQLVNDFLPNLAIADMCQNPVTPNVMYAATGESYYNIDAVQGAGVFKTTDNGVTWTLLPSTAAYVSCTKILCDYLGNVYLSTRDNGLLRSVDGGITWVNITPSGMGTSRIGDMEISSTTVQGRLHIASGISSSSVYRYTTDPATVTSSTWTAPITPYPNFNKRTEICVSGNTLYALPVNASNQVPIVYKSIDGGKNWAATDAQPNLNWAAGQGWYSLSCAINPANPDMVTIGGLDCHQTTDGGITWLKISAWVGTVGQYVHADQHDIAWYDGGNKMIFACDGGIHYSTNNGTTIRDRNIGLRIKQFYSIAIHPTQANYLLGGTQDNGMHQLNNPGLAGSVEVTGGDGGFAAIDQNEPQFQFGAYINNVYRRSTNNGANWSTVSFNADIGQFINPFSYDNNTNKFYASYANGNYLRWNDPQTGNSSDLVSVLTFNNRAVSCVFASPYTPNRVYFGTEGGRIIKIDNAHVGNVATGDIDITGPAMPANNYMNCINTGTSDQNIVATYTNYNTNNIWVTTNGGTSWTAVDGNLPNMPVYWAIYNPDDNNRMVIATETGVWMTNQLNGAATVWIVCPTFPNVRTDMLQYRTSDRLIAAGTHGRGVWTGFMPTVCPAPVVTQQPSNIAVCTGNNTSLNFNLQNTGSYNYQWQVSTNGGSTFTAVTNGTNYTGATEASLSVLNIPLGFNTYQYRCVITTSCLPLTTTTTAAATLSVSPATTITTQPLNRVVCEGGNTNFSITTSNSVGVTYQWQVSFNGNSYSSITNNTTYSGATTSTLVLTGVSIAMQSYSYRCVVTTLCASFLSDDVLLSVYTTTAITQQPTDVGICAGNLATFTTTATGVLNNYQWQVSANNGTTYTNIASATSNTYSVAATPAVNNNLYRCVVTGFCNPSVTSTGARLTVFGALVINSQPTSNTICEAQNTSYNVTATGVVNNYQWQVSTNGGSTFTNLSNGGIYSNVNSNTLNLTAITLAEQGNQYRCVLTGNCPAINTTAALLTIVAKPTITTNPIAAISTCQGQNLSLACAATGLGATYQWQVSSNGGSTFANITTGSLYSGTATNTLSIIAAPLSISSYQYRCTVSGTCSPAVTTSTTTLTVNTPVSLTTQPVNTTICATGTSSFNVVAQGTGVTYQWQVSTNSGTSYTNITGEVGATLTLTNILFSSNNNLYRCVVSGTAPCGALTSTSASLNVNAQPTVTLSAAPLISLLPGKTTTLTATSNITGSNITYSWLYNTQPLSNTTNAYTVNTSTVGNYQVTVRDNASNCFNTSNIATIVAEPSTKLYIFPNPNNGVFTVSYYNSQTTATTQSLTIYDAKGSLIYDKTFATAQAYQLHQINIQKNKSGEYFIQLGDANRKRIATGVVLVNK